MMVKKKPLNKILEELCHDREKLIDICDDLVIWVKSIEHLRILQCGEDEISEKNGNQFL